MIVIIGGGASVQLADIHRVARYRLAHKFCSVTAINDAVYAAWWADRLHAADSVWWRENWPRVRTFAGNMSTVGTAPPGVYVHTVTGVAGYDDTLGNIRTGNGSGFQALHIALQGRPEKVILLGYDMAGPNWYDPAGDERTDYNSTMRPHFDSLVEPAKRLGVDVINCSMESRLSCFRKQSLASLI